MCDVFPRIYACDCVMLWFHHERITSPLGHHRLSFTVTHALFSIYDTLVNCWLFVLYEPLKRQKLASRPSYFYNAYLIQPLSLLVPLIPQCMEPSCLNHYETCQSDVKSLFFLEDLTQQHILNNTVTQVLSVSLPWNTYGNELSINNYGNFWWGTPDEY